MRYNEIINELFDAPTPFTFEMNGDRVNAQFNSGKYQYTVEFDRACTGTYNLAFHASEIKDDGNIGHMPLYGVIASNNASEVFSTVTAIVMRFLANKDPLVVAFEADEQSRRKLYLRMMKRITSLMSDYEGCQSELYSGYFAIRRKWSEGFPKSFLSDMRLTGEDYMEDYKVIT